MVRPVPAKSSREESLTDVRVGGEYKVSARGGHCWCALLFFGLRLLGHGVLGGGYSPVGRRLREVVVLSQVLHTFGRLSELRLELGRLEVLVLAEFNTDLLEQLRSVLGGERLTAA